jgi:hypothetical protein
MHSNGTFTVLTVGSLYFHVMNQTLDLIRKLKSTQKVRAIIFDFSLVARVDFSSTEVCHDASVGGCFSLMSKGIRAFHRGYCREGRSQGRCGQHVQASAHGMQKR